MFRVIKKNRSNLEFICVNNANECLDGLIFDFETYVKQNFNFPSQITQDEVSDFKNTQILSIEDYIFEIDEVAELSDEEIVACEGGVCMHCHSDYVSADGLSIEDGYINKILTCMVCDQETLERYDLAGSDC